MAYWKDTYQNPLAAKKALQLALSGKKYMTPQQIQIARMAATSQPQHLGSFFSTLKKIVDPGHLILKKSKKKAAVAAPAAGAPAPIAASPSTAVTLPDLAPPPQAMNFSSGGGGSPVPGSVMPAPADASAGDSGLSTPVMLGLAGAGLLLVWMMFRKK